jgi:adenylate cyclase
LTAGEKILLEKWKSSKSSEQDAPLVQTQEKPDEGRRLAAVMFTDIVGYTALTQKDETIALEIVEEHRALLRPLFQRYTGNEIKTMGDGFIVEFQSALEAVKCSLDIQSTVTDSNSNHPLERKFQLRIGIHLGDVIHKNNDIYGDAVNIASRMMPLCVPGSVCVTEQVYSQVKNKIDKPFVSVGKKKLKNVVTPVKAYALKM